MQHSITEEQKTELFSLGINTVNKTELSETTQLFLKGLGQIPPTIDSDEIFTIATKLIETLKQEGCVGMVFAGEPSLTFALGKAQAINQFFGVSQFDVVFATSERVAIEKLLPDGSTSKESIFKHVKFRLF